MPTISVIVPVYKVEAYLGRCVDSILRQTFTDFELILVDDGSPDHCGAICDEYAAKDSRIHVIHQENGGLSAARNAGIDWMMANSDSQWITFVDSDDWIHPEMLSVLYRAVVENKVNVSVCGFLKTSGEVPVVKLEQYNGCLYTPEEFLTSVAWGKLYHRSCFTEIRYPVGRLHEDEFTTYRILFRQEKFAVTNAPLYFYYQNDNGIMRSKWSPRRLDAVEALKEQTDFLKLHGFQKAYAVTAAEYAATIMKQRKFVQESELTRKQKQKYDKYLLHCLRKASWDYKDIYLKQEHGVYLEAYPVLTWIYRTTKKILNLR